MSAAAPAVATTVHRIEVRPRPGLPDARGEAALREASGGAAGPAPTRIAHAAVYLVEGGLDATTVRRIADELLADPVTQQAFVGASPPPADATVVEVHPLPGVTDPAAESVELAIEALLDLRVAVRTGNRWDVFGLDAAAAAELAGRLLANPVIHSIHRGPFVPRSFPTPAAHDASTAMAEVVLRSLDDAALERLSRDAHLFLSLDEMRAVRDHYRTVGREPREIELETIAQTWSEHCVHKTLKSTIRYIERGSSPHAIRAAGRPGHEDAGEAVGGGRTTVIRNLLRSTIAAATHELMADGVDWCLSVFVDNAGVVAFDDEHAVCFKCETHNHPSAIEPYGGAATGIGGCIRDVMGTGLGAKPIASTDVFCVAPPDLPGSSVPAGCLHPRRILRQVVAGVRDYGNRMGIPTVNGAVWFDEDHVGNPLVYCGCIGVMPRDKVKGRVADGDRIVAIGGRTGRDGIHGATFSSAELTDTHADEFSHAVQIGNAITQKKALDAILALRDHPQGCLFHAITDCGAGGFSSAVGEMGRELGAEVHLDRAPLKYAGLSPTEVWISEAQERMVLAVPPRNLDRVRRVCADHEVDVCDLGVFGGDGNLDGDLVLRWHGAEVGRLSTRFLEEALPTPTREAVFEHLPPRPPAAPRTPPPPLRDVLPRLLAHPNIASKHWIIRQYDHEVQGGAAVKPLVGPAQEGPSDAAVIRPVRDSARGLAIANGLATGLRDDPYLMALAAIDECVRNLVSVGADPSRIAILDNFSWPSCKDPRHLGALVRAAEGCRDAAKAYRTPFISGKDSLNNQFTTEDGRTIAIPPTLLVSGMAVVDDVRRCVTSDLKEDGDVLLLVGPRGGSLRGSHAARLLGRDAGELPAVDLVRGPATARAVAAAIGAGLVRSAHDVGDGGLAAALAEMAIGGRLGVAVDLADATGEDLFVALVNEAPSRYVLEVREADLAAIRAALGAVPHEVVGRVTAGPRFVIAAADVDAALDELRSAWRGTLDW